MRCEILGVDTDRALDPCAKHALPDWLEAAVETGRPGLPPLGFAFDLMTRWCYSGHTLEQIAAQHLVF